MYQAVTEFKALTHWGAGHARDLLNRRPNITAVPKWNEENSGTLVISAPTEEEVDSALSWIKCHSFFGKYFKLVVDTFKLEKR